MNKLKTLLKGFGLKKLFWCLLLVAIAIVSVVFLFPNNDAVPMASESIEPFNEHWMLENTGEEISLPYILKTEANTSVKISKVLPDVFTQSNPTLSFHSSLQSVTVEVDNRVIYTYCEEPDVYFEVLPPPAWHIIRLSPDMEGKALSITFSSPYRDYSGVLNSIDLGTKYANVSNFVSSNLLSMALCFIIFVFGLFAIVICMFAHNKVAGLSQLLYLGIASLLISLWSVCETKSIQIFTGNVQAIMFITFLSIMLFPIPFLLFFREKFSGNIRKIYNLLIAVFSLYFIIAVVSQIFSIANFNDFFFIFLMLIVVKLSFVSISLILKYRNQKTSENRLSVIAVLALFAFSMIDMFLYLFKNLALTSYSDTSVFARIGILTMLFILGYSSIRQNLMYYSEHSKAEVYKMMAQTDSMSGLKNRAYLSAVCLEQFNDAAKNQTPFSVIIADIDNFKNYNDHYGHNDGDKVLLEVANILKTETASLGGVAIRYGGEEFLLVLPNTKTEKAVLLAEKVKQELAAKKLIHEYSEADSIVTMSLGIYCAVPCPNDSLEHFIDNADKAMYFVKRNSKNGYYVYNEENPPCVLADNS